MRRPAALALLLLAAAIPTAAPPSTARTVSQSAGQAQIAVARASGALVLIDQNGRRIETLTSHRGWSDWAPAWSADGQQLAFARSTDGRRSFHVYVMGADGGPARRLTSGRFDEHPSWSPDGASIVYASSDHRGSVRVVASTGGRSRLVVAGTPGAAPSWTPDGRIAYSFHPEMAADRPSSCRRASARCGWVWTSRADGTQRRPVLRGRDAHWSADGRMIVYTLPNGGVAVRRAGAASGRNLGRGYLADWSSDARWIVFARLGLRPGADSVWLMTASGAKRHRLIGGATTPAWRPD